MAAIGFATLWVAYTLGLYGYILIKGYDLSPRDMFNLKQWPPA